jgi:hypothetical protein
MAFARMEAMHRFVGLQSDDASLCSGYKTITTHIKAWSTLFGRDPVVPIDENQKIWFRNFMPREPDSNYRDPRSRRLMVRGLAGWFLATYIFDRHSADYWIDEPTTYGWQAMVNRLRDSG